MILRIDLSGTRRRALSTAVVTLLALLPASASALVITEVMYHPAGENQRQFEYIELYNENADPLDLSGFSICNGVRFTFPDGVFLDGKTFIVVCADQDTIQAAYGITNTIGNWEGALDNGGERIEICNPGGVTLVEVRYDDRGKWAVGADGAGHSLSLIDPYLEIDDPDSWTLSEELGGTPGDPNTSAFEHGIPTVSTGNGIDSAGFITNWLVLGPYEGSSCNLGGRLTRDWLRSNTVSEDALLWEDGQQVDTNYSVAASTGLHSNGGSRPRVSEYSSLGDTINFNDAVWPPDPNQVMAYAFCYVDNIADRRLAVTIGCASDDAISILLNGEYVHSNDACRGVGGAGQVQDRANATLEPGKNLVAVKVFENGGGWSFRLRFEERNTGKPLVSNSEIQVTTDYTMGMEFGGGGDPIETPDEPPPPPPEPGAPTASFPVVINEALLRAVDPRWVELYNTSSQTVDLSGLHLTDDNDDLARVPAARGHGDLSARLSGVHRGRDRARLLRRRCRRQRLHRARERDRRQGP